MNLQTKTDIKPLAQKLSHKSKILMLGSCFSNNISEHLSAAKFDVCTNPFGVIYNPVSIANSVKLLIENKEINENELLLHNDLYFNFAYHTSFSAGDKQNVLQKMNEAKQQAADFLKNADFIIITYGTADAYKHKKSDEVVANCHKISACEFEKISLSVGDIVEVTNAAIKNICAINYCAKFIFTVSPIRHLSTGAHQNQLSKSRLLLAIDKICNSNHNCQYFPVYEIMNDELRDYRFYADDMLHPSKLAVDYIWQKFTTAAICNDSLKIMEELKKISAAKAHRTFNQNTEEHKKFLKNYLEKTKQLQAKYSFLNLKDELEYFGKDVEVEKY